MRVAIAALGVLLAITTAGCAGLTGDVDGRVDSDDEVEVEEVVDERTSSRTRQSTAPPKCPGHWHFVFAMYLDGEPVEFEQPPYSIAGEGGDMPIMVHMHTPDQNTVHIEPTRERCISADDTFTYLGVAMTDDGFVLGDGHSPAGSSSSVQVWFAVVSGEGGSDADPMAWDEFRAMTQVPDNAKVLIAGGEASDEQMQEWWAALPEPPAFR